MTVIGTGMAGWFRVASIAALRLVAWSTTNVAAFMANGTDAFFWWNAASSAADDGVNTIKPDDAGVAAGRWIKATL